MMKSERTFKLWEYSVSHQQLLLRSPKNDKYSTNIDVVFMGVSYCEIETNISGLVLRNGTVDESKDMSLLLKKNIEMLDLFVLESGNKKYHIVAAAMKTDENRMDIFDSALEQWNT